MISLQPDGVTFNNLHFELTKFIVRNIKGCKDVRIGKLKKSSVPLLTINF